MPQDVAPVELSNLQPDPANHATRTTQSALSNCDNAARGPTEPGYHHHSSIDGHHLSDKHKQRFDDRLYPTYRI